MPWHQLSADMLRLELNMAENKPHPQVVSHTAALSTATPGHYPLSGYSGAGRTRSQNTRLSTHYSGAHLHLQEEAVFGLR